MKLTYAIADLHGRFDLLQAAFDSIGKHAAGRMFKVVTLGDYIDRGPQSMQIIRHLMAAQSMRVPVICLKGNHEAMMVETIRTPLPPEWWIGNGGGATLRSYGHGLRDPYDPSVVPAEHLNWIDRLPMIYADQHRVFVHAGVDPNVALDQQKEQVLTWFIYPDRANVGHGDRHVVHGHEQHAHGPQLFECRTNLDTFAWSTGRLIVGVFDDDVAGGPVELLEIKREPRRV